jgi:hypothetical protein
LLIGAFLSLSLTADVNTPVRLPASQMDVYGLQPVRDAFVVVVCKGCNKPVLISAFGRHCAQCIALTQAPDGSGLAPALAIAGPGSGLPMAPRMAPTPPTIMQLKLPQFAIQPSQIAQQQPPAAPQHSQPAQQQQRSSSSAGQKEAKPQKSSSQTSQLSSSASDVTLVKPGSLTVRLNMGPSSNSNSSSSAAPAPAAAASSSSANININNNQSNKTTATAGAGKVASSAPAPSSATNANANGSSVRIVLSRSNSNALGSGVAPADQANSNAGGSNSNNNNNNTNAGDSNVFNVSNGRAGGSANEGFGERSDAVMMSGSSRQQQQQQLQLQLQQQQHQQQLARRKEISVLEIKKGDDEEGKVTIMVEGGWDAAYSAPTSQQRSGGGAPLATKKWTRRNRLTGLSLSLKIRSAEESDEESSFWTGETSGGNLNEGWSYHREKRRTELAPETEYIVGGSDATKRRYAAAVPAKGTKKPRERDE